MTNDLFSIAASGQWQYQGCPSTTWWGLPSRTWNHWTLSLNDATDVMSESSTLKTDVYIWHYELIVVYATNEYKKVIQNTVWCCWWWGGLRTTAFCQARWSIISWCAFPCLWLRCHWFHRILPVTFIEWFTCLTAWSAPMLMNSERKEPVLMQKVFKLASLWLR